MSAIRVLLRSKDKLSHTISRFTKATKGIIMDKLLQKQIATIQLMRKTQFPWEPDQIWPQQYHKYSNGKWTTLDISAGQDAQPASSLSLYSWNIDFMLPYPTSRMLKAIDLLKTLVSKQSPETATVVFLQESLQSDLDLLASTQWIQEAFFISDLDTSNWSSAHYGTVTLVDKRVHIKNSFRIHYSQTQMERDAFFTDIAIGREGRLVRLCNTHLESLAVDPPRRPHQVRLCAQYMHDSNIFGAAMAGDFNAIQDFDRQLYADNALKDAYLELGGQEDSDDGYTWGQQAATYQRNMFGCSRMDKVFFCGGLRLKSFDRFGAGVEVNDESERKQLVELGFDKPWITDHLGVRAHFGIDSEQEEESGHSETAAL